MKKLIILLVSASCLLSSCSKDLDDAVFIRFYNQSDKELYDASFFSKASDGITDVENNYGTIAPEFATTYKAYKKVYYPLFKFTMAGHSTLEIKEVRCGMGLGDLPPGKYTLVVWEENSQPMINFVKD